MRGWLSMRVGCASKRGIFVLLTTPGTVSQHARRGRHRKVWLHLPNVSRKNSAGLAVDFLHWERVVREGFEPRRRQPADVQSPDGVLSTSVSFHFPRCGKENAASLS